MITEDYVSVETAKLLKEKGFDWIVERCFLEHKNYYVPCDPSHIQMKDRKDAIAITTLQMAMKWLREVHNLEIYPFHDAFQECTNWWYRIEHYKKGCASVKDESDSIYDTYEKACEAAIKYCLKNLI